MLEDGNARERKMAKEEGREIWRKDGREEKKVGHVQEEEKAMKKKARGKQRDDA